MIPAAAVFVEMLEVILRLAAFWAACWWLVKIAALGYLVLLARRALPAGRRPRRADRSDPIEYDAPREIFLLGAVLVPIFPFLAAAFGLLPITVIAVINAIIILVGGVLRFAAHNLNDSVAKYRDHVGKALGFVTAGLSVLLLLPLYAR